MTKLGQFIESVSERNKSGLDIPVYSVSNTQGFCSEYFSKNVASKNTSTYKIVRKGYFAYNPSRINVGSVDFLRSADSVLVSPIYNVFRLLDGIDRRYLLYFLKSPLTQEEIDRRGKGGIRNNLKLETLADFDINIPSIEKQIKTVEVFESIERIIRLQEKYIETNEKLIKRVFLDTFGNPITNPKGWIKKPLLELGSLKNGMNFHEDNSGLSLPFVGVGDFKDKLFITVDSLRSTVILDSMPPSGLMLKDGDILLVRSNGNRQLVGRSVLVYPGKEKVTYSGFCIRYRITSEDILPMFVLSFFKYPTIRKILSGQSSGSNITNLNQRILSQLTIPIPPIELQRHYGEAVKGIYESMCKLKKQTELLVKLRNSLMRRFFSTEC